LYHTFSWFNHWGDRHADPALFAIVNFTSIQMVKKDRAWVSPDMAGSSAEMHNPRNRVFRSVFIEFSDQPWLSINNIHFR